MTEFDPNNVDWDHIQKVGRSPIPGPPHWPRGVQPVSIDGMALLGLDEEGVLYWDGKPVQIRKQLDLTAGERWFAIIVGVFTILGALGAVAQGWAAAHQWACQTSIIAKGCPAPK